MVQYCNCIASDCKLIYVAAKYNQNAYMLCKVSKTRKLSRNVLYSTTSSRAWQVLSVLTARTKTVSPATAARNMVCSCCLRASSSPTSEGRSQYSVCAQRQNSHTDTDCQSTSTS